MFELRDLDDLLASGEDYEEAIDDILPNGWETDSYGFSANLICPHGHTIEQDGRCPDGCVSPLIDMGLI